MLGNAKNDGGVEAGGGGGERPGALMELRGIGGSFASRQVL